MSRAFDRLSFAETFENHIEGIAYIGERTEIKDCNETFRRMTGIGEGPLERFDSLVHPTFFDAWSSGLARFMEDKDGRHRLILRLARRGAVDRWIRLTFLPLKDIDDEGFLIFAGDITAQKTLETRLIQARDKAEKATATKSEFLANTSHEIRTPIHTVLATAELLSETKLDEEQSDYLDKIQFSGKVLLTLINDILDFSKMEAGQLQLERTEFDLVFMLEGAVDLVTLEAHKKNVDVGLFLDSGVPHRIVGDPTRLRQVVVNLINNAVKFTKKGQIILDVESLETSETKVRLKFAVTDSGIGIPLEKQPNLFQAFHQADSSTTRRYGGTGLGLFISLNIVRQMGGALSFTSEPGEGSSFFFELEFDRADGGIPLPIVPSNFFNRRRVLIVDDNDVIRDRLRRIFESWGLHVSEAGSAEEALFLMRSKTIEGYQLLVVDQTMPHIDGWQFASMVHSEFGKERPPMVLMSMKSGRGTMEARMKLLGWFDSYLSKPLRYGDLAATVFRLLGRDLDLEAAGDLEEVEELDEAELLAPTVGRRILIAEDHEVNRSLFHTILEKKGHEVLEAVNGQEAWELAEAEKPDLIFMDCQMPVMNGYESTEKIRGLGYGGPIVAVTASALAEERERCIASGMDDLVVKPFKQADILMVIERYLGVSRKAPAGSTETSSEKIRPAKVSPGNGQGTQAAGTSCAAEDKDSGIRGIPGAAEIPGVPEFSSPNLPVFDFDTAVARFTGNADIVRNLLPKQISKVANDLEIIRNAVNKGDFETLRVTAHAIKGSCRNLDMVRCGEAAAGLEQAGKDGDTAAAAAGLKRLEQEFPVLKAAVEKVLSE